MRIKVPLLLALLCCTSCDYSLPEVESITVGESLFSEGVLEALAAGAVAVGEWPQEEWWRDFGDPALDAFMATALEGNFSLKVAEERITLAYQKAVVVGSFRYPQLSFDPSFERQELSNNGEFPLQQISIIPRVFNLTTLLLNFSYLVDVWKRQQRLFRAAMDEEVATSLDFVAAKLLLTADIAQSYFALQDAMEKRAIAEALLANRERRIETATERLEGGLDALDASLVAESEIEGARTALLSLQQQVELQQHQLGTLLGTGSIPSVTPRGSYCGAVPLPAALPLELLSRRPEIVAQGWRVARASQLVGAAVANYYPNINLLASLGLQSTQFNNLFSAGSLLWDGIVALSLPIFDGGRRGGLLGGARSEFRIAVYNYNDAILKAVQDVLDRLTVLRTVEAMLGAERRVLEDAEGQFSLARSRYEGGLSNLVEYLDAEERWLKAREQVVEQESMRLVAIVGLMQALGGGYVCGTDG